MSATHVERTVFRRSVGVIRVSVAGRPHPREERIRLSARACVRRTRVD